MATNTNINLNPMAIRNSALLDLGLPGLDDLNIPELQALTSMNNGTQNSGIGSAFNYGTNQQSSALLGNPQVQGIGLGQGNQNTLDLSKLMESQQRWQGIGMGIQGLSALGNLYLGAQSLDIARSNARLQRQAYETNLEASRADYNRQLGERRERALRRNGTYSESALNAYMEQHGL